MASLRAARVNLGLRYRVQITHSSTCYHELTGLGMQSQQHLSIATVSGMLVNALSFTQAAAACDSGMCSKADSLHCIH